MNEKLETITKNDDFIQEVKDRADAMDFRARVAELRFRRMADKVQK